jgi:hypothetical protein
MAGTVAMNDQLRQLSSFFGFDSATLTTMLQSRNQSSLRGSAARDQTAETVRSLVILQQRLDELFTSHAGVERWLHGPSGYFGGDAPYDHLAAGEIERVNAALDAIEAGIFV